MHISFSEPFSACGICVIKPGFEMCNFLSQKSVTFTTWPWQCSPWSEWTHSILLTVLPSHKACKSFLWIYYRLTFSLMDTTHKTADDTTVCKHSSCSLTPAIYACIPKYLHSMYAQMLTWCWISLRSAKVMDSSDIPNIPILLLCTLETDL